MIHDLPIATDWFAVTWVTASVALLNEPHVDAFLQGNIWYVRGRERDLLIDAGNGIAPLRPVLERFSHGKRREIVALATHAHADHIGGLHEFERRLLHPKEAQAARHLDDKAPLVAATWHDKLADALEEEGFIIPPILIDARPSEDFDPAAFRIAPVAATHNVQGGDLVDLGDRQLQVVDLPGHTPGSIGVWDERDGALYSGDAVYEEGLIDTLPESSIEDYLHTMRRLRDLTAEVVYPGHDAPFGRERLQEIAGEYLRRRGENAQGS